MPIFSVNKTLFRRDILRIWPIWVCLSGALAFFFLPSVKYAADTLAANADKYLFAVTGYKSAETILAIYVAVYLTVFLEFGFLHGTQSANFFLSLPVKRADLFFTKLLVSLSAVLTPIIVFSLGAAAIFGMSDYIAAGVFNMVFAAVCFTGMAVLTAVLIGQSMAYFAVGAASQFAGMFALTIFTEYATKSLYGITSTSLSVTKNSAFADLLWPVVHFADAFFTYDPINTAEHYFWYIYLPASFILAGFGIVCMGLACFAFVKRRAENSGSIITFGWLRPVFKYAATFYASYAALYFAAPSELTRDKLTQVCLLVIAGAVVGYFAAEMLMQKTTHVFRKNHLGLVVATAVLLMFPIATELDVLGVESRIPAADKIESVYMPNGVYYTSPGDIENVRQLHGYLIGQKAEYESDKTNRQPVTVPCGTDGSPISYPDMSRYFYSESIWGTQYFNSHYPEYISLTYNLKDGKTIHRYYNTSSLSYSQAAMDGLSNLFYKVARTAAFAAPKVFYSGVEDFNTPNVTAALWLQFDDGSEAQSLYEFDNGKALQLYAAIIEDMNGGNIIVDEISPPLPEKPGTLEPQQLTFYKEIWYTADQLAQLRQQGNGKEPDASYILNYTLTLDTRAEKTLSLLESWGIE